MSKADGEFENSKTSKVFALLSIGGFILALLSRFMDFYQVAFMGALFELFWLPMLTFIFVLPIVSLILWRTEKYNRRSLNIIPLLILCASLLLIIFSP